MHLPVYFRAGGPLGVDDGAHKNRLVAHGRGIVALMADADELIRGAQADASAHSIEHCLEVQLPFLHRARSSVRIVPIVLGHQSDEVYEQLGLCLAGILTERRLRHASGAPLLVSSTDLSHYESDATTRIKDAYAIEAIRHLDPAGLGEAVRTHRITMCGYAPTVTMLHAVRILGATSASLIRYATSGDITGEHDRVVGYAGLIVR